MVLAALLLPLAAQTAFTAQAVTAPPAGPGTPAFERNKAEFERELRYSCLSADGVSIVIADWTRRRAEAARTGANPEWSRLDRKIAEAAYATPVDMKRLEKAIRENGEYRANIERTAAEEGIAVLHKLSPGDRQIYARRFTLMRPVEPPRTCGTIGG